MATPPIKVRVHILRGSFLLWFQAPKTGRKARYLCWLETSEHLTPGEDCWRELSVSYDLVIMHALCLETGHTVKNLRVYYTACCVTGFAKWDWVRKHFYQHLCAVLFPACSYCPVAITWKKHRIVCPRTHADTQKSRSLGSFLKSLGRYCPVCFWLSRN